MSYAPPTSSLEPVWAGEPSYRAPHANLPASWNSAQHYIGPAGLASHAEPPPPSFAWDQFIVAQGFSDSVAALRTWALRQNTYRDPQYTVSASWVGAEVYGPPIYTFTATWAAITYITATGIPEEGVGDPVLIQTQFAAPDGWDSSVFGDAWAIYPWEYAPPEWVLDVSWVGRPTYNGKDSQVEGHWTLPSESKAVPLVGWDSLVVSDGLNLKHSLEYLEPTGFNAALFGVAYLANKAAPLRPTGLAAGAYGRPEVWNWRTYSAIPGFNALSFGELLASGGVKQVTLAGIPAPVFRGPLVVNTTANQTVIVRGVSELSIGLHHVSPITLFTKGFLAGQFGYPLIQPNPNPKGFVADGYGTPEIIYKTRWVKPASAYDFAAGYPLVRDKAQTVLHKSSPVTAVFGDTSARLKNFFIRPSGHHSLELSSWAELRNLNRYIGADGFAHWSIGDSSIRNKWPTVAPTGWESTVFGDCGIGWRTRSIIPIGVIAPFNQAPSPVLWQTPSLKPLGIQPPLISRHSVWPAIRIVEQLGADMLRAGAPTVDFTYRLVRLEGRGVDGSAYGRTRIETSIRHLYQRGSSSDVYGRPWVSFGQRRIEPESIWFKFASNHMVGGLRFIGPDGFDAARFGTRIIPESQMLYPAGFAGTFGTAKLLNQKLFVKPASITTYSADTMRFGVGKLWSLVQVITQNYDEANGLTPPDWPQWTAIANRNRYVRTIGENASAVARPYIENGARGIYPAGGAPAWAGSLTNSGMIAYRIRYLPIEGLEQPYITSWSRIYNSAFPLKPVGFVAELFGNARIQNTRRFYERVGNFDSAVLGYPFIAYAVRTIEFERRYSISPPLIHLPKAELSTRYIEAPGFESTLSQVGKADLSIHRNIISPSWKDNYFYGYPSVKNTTPELITKGRNHEDIGVSSVRLEWRKVFTGETYATLFGKALIADTRREIPVAGIKSLNVSDKLKVIKTGAPPYTQQFIWLTWIDKDKSEDPNRNGDGIPAPSPAFGIAVINQQVIYVKEQYPQTKTGTPIISANSIRVEPGYYDFFFGEPTVDLKIRNIIVGEFQDSEVFQPSTEIRMSPHTIYAVKEAPQQALKNHPSTGLHYVGQVLGYAPGERFGLQRIEHRHKTVLHRSTFVHTLGRPTVINKLSNVLVKGFLSMRTGWPIVPGKQDIIVFSSQDSSAFGSCKIAYPPYFGPAYIKPKWTTIEVPKPPEISLFNRQLAPSGYEATLMGSKLKSDSPYQWKGLRVGELMPTIPNGFNSEMYGLTWVSLRVRGVSAFGFDSFTTELTPEKFMFRMTVKNAKTSQAPTMRITTIGAEHSVIGPASVIPMLHFIRPDGNSDQHRKGAW